MQAKSIVTEKRVPKNQEAPPSVGSKQKNSIFITLTKYSLLCNVEAEDIMLAKNKKNRFDSTYGSQSLLIFL